MTSDPTADLEVPQPAAAGLATGGTEQPAPIESVPHKHRWVLIECNNDRDRYECACGEYFTERCSFDEEYS